ncbi:MAG: hypothetical protein IT190_03665 [Microbacteriaceae bacterium]|nr:hypothetical protein [Microbacteriaceae bacterium]
MVIIVAVLVGYLIVRLVTWLRWGFKVDIESMMAKAVVTPAVQRQRLGRAESVGIRVRDLTGFIDGRRRRRRRRARKTFFVWAVVPSFFVALGWSPWIGGAIIALVLLVSLSEALGSLVRGLVSAMNTGRRVRGILLSVVIVLAIFGGSTLALWSAQLWGWPWPDSVSNLRTGTEAAAIGVALVGLSAWGLAALTRSLNDHDVSADIGSDGTTLWLRSFGDDNIRVTAVGSFGVLSWVFGFRVRLEEFVARWVLAHGPLVAIGRPGEPYPLLGATRTYVRDDQWKQVVESAARSAEAIILLAGSSAGLGWEVDHVAASDRRDRVLVLLPPLPYEQSLLRLANLRQQLGLSDLEALDGIEDGTSTQFSLTVVAVGISLTGRTVYYCGYGRSWMDLEAAVEVGLLGIRRMISDPPLHGTIWRESDPTFPLSPQ